MNTMQARGQWNQMKGGFRMRWSKMTDNPKGMMSGRMLSLKGKTQESYGRLTEATGKRVKKFTGD